MAGLGNVFKSEVLFLCGVNPFAPVADVTDAALDCLIERGRALITLNVAEHAVVAGTSAAASPPAASIRARSYGSTAARGQPCFKCGTPIRSASETEGRRTYWCPGVSGAARVKRAGKRHRVAETISPWSDAELR